MFTSEMDPSGLMLAAFNTVNNSGNNPNANGKVVAIAGVGKSQRYSMYWTLEKEILLIKYFEQHRYMWDTNHILFHKREPRMQGFAELVELLGIDEGTIRQRWSSMRSQFCREERKVSLCPTYIPTWDHYGALQFLRKPFEERLFNPRPSNSDMTGTVVTDPQYREGEEDLGSEDSHQSMNIQEHDEVNNMPSGFRLSQIADQLVGRLMGQTDSGVQVELADREENCEIVTPNTPPPALEIKTEPPSDMHLPVSIAQPPTPSQLVRKSRTPRQRRWTPGYNRKYQEISTMASASINSNNGPSPVNEQPIRMSTENEAFVQYMSSVLERFPHDKQRRCRNELLCTILKYDSFDDEEVLSPASHG